jgi:hypothetical protein
MDATTLHPFQHASVDPFEHDLVEIDAAIDLVVRGLATRVQLVGLAGPEVAAATGLARAQEAHVAFALDRSSAGAVAVTLGPRS